MNSTKYFPILSLLLLFMCGAKAQNDPQFSKNIQAHRKAYLSAFKAMPQTPLSKKQVKQVQFFPPDERYFVPAQFTPTPEAQPFELPHYSGITRPYVQYGIVRFQLNGQELSLNVYRSLNNTLPQYRDLLFIPFKDLSNGQTTYGGGRYLDLRIKSIIDNELMLDFNKAYNPYCAYSEGYACPIPPAENHLQVNIGVGEKDFKGKEK